MGAYDQALPLYQRALQIYEKVLGPEHPDTATSLSNLGYLYLLLKDFQQAEGYFKKGKSKAGLVELYLATGRAAEALGLLKGMTPTWRTYLPPTRYSITPNRAWPWPGWAVWGRRRRPW